MVKSKALGVFDACYIFCNYYKSLKKESYEKADDLIDDYDDDDDYDDYDDDDAVDGDGNDPDFITDVELKVQNTQNKKSERHILSSHFQIIQSGYLKELYKN